MAAQTASTGTEGIRLAASHPPDLILLDINLPDMNGQEVLRQLRQWYTRPVIMLSVLNDEQGVVQALDNGATDYLTKPFRTGELLARMRSCMRRQAADPGNPVIRIGDLEIDLAAMAVRRNGELIHLTSTEFHLLSLMASNEGRVLTHRHLLREVWGVGHQDDTQYLRVFVAQLRKKLEADPARPAHIITESGVGYRFC
jgi:two-component system KDP operon response regulator KdpE